MNKLPARSWFWQAELAGSWFWHLVPLSGMLVGLPLVRAAPGHGYNVPTLGLSNPLPGADTTKTPPNKAIWLKQMVEKKV